MNKTTLDRPLRILHTESSTGWGGQEIRILTEARGMLERGHQVTLLTPACGDIFPAAQKLGVPVVDVPLLKKRPRDLLALYRWCKAHRGEYDVINTHSSTDSWLAALVAQLLPGFPPILRTRHVSTAVNNAATTRWLYARATAHIVTTGEALRQQLNRDNGLPLERMTSVPTGIDLARYAPRDQATLRAKLGVAERPTIGIVATLRDWKGHDYLLDAFAELRQRHPDWQLLIVGDGPRRAHLEARVAAAGLNGQVRFVGNQDNVEEWLPTFDLFTLPSYGDEGVPQGIMQAMASGLAVVSTPVGAIGEAVVADQTGLMVPPHDAAALGAALERLLTDAALRTRMADAGLRRARERFGIARMLDAMETIFAQVAAKR
ncbi:MAG: glycosyltransferase family 4 protein [Sterolibacterium sp.]